MSNYITQSFKKQFSDPEVIVLLTTITLTTVLILLLSGMLMPVFVSVAIAYLLHGLVLRFVSWKCPRGLAVIISYLIFISLLVFSLVVIVPLLWTQLSNLFGELPRVLGKSQVLLTNLQHRYPEYITTSQYQHLLSESKVGAAKIGQVILSYSISTIPSLIALIVYLVLVPLMVLFFIKDSSTILAWCSKYMPKKRGLTVKVWSEVNTQLGNYIRGKTIEMFIVGIITIVAFEVLGLQYSFLLGCLIGISVFVPYVGIVLVTIPVIIVGLMQWGWTTPFIVLMIVYTLISVLDGNVLVPLLFSETMQLHPVVIIIAVLFFGGVWGFWGIFFAIPLATVVKAVLNVWPNTD